MGEVLAYAIALYRCVVCFAIMRVIQAVFITGTTNALKHDEDLQSLKRQDEQNYVQRSFLQIFHALDMDKDGYLEWEDFQNIVNEPRIMDKFKTQDIDPYDLKRLFNYLDDGDGKISIDEFINGTLKARGEARCLELLHVLGDVRKLSKKFDSFVITSSYDKYEKLPFPPPPDCSTNSQLAFPERSIGISEDVSRGRNDLGELATRSGKLIGKFVPNEYAPIKGIGPRTPKKSVKKLERTASSALIQD
jgi:hypothetical protein